MSTSNQAFVLTETKSGINWSGPYDLAEAFEAARRNCERGARSRALTLHDAFQAGAVPTFTNCHQAG